MTDAYHGTSARPGVDEQLAEAGWRREIGQLLRFETALAAWDWEAIDSVLDLGCGPGGLARYLAETDRSVRYVGVEARASAVESAREHLPAGAEVRHGDLFDDEIVDETFDLVVAIGAQVDGTPPDRKAERVDRMRRLTERSVSLAERGTAIVVLDQAALQARPAFGLEPALFGVTDEELREIAATPGRTWQIRGDFLETDLALYVHDGTEVYRPERSGDTAHERVVETHFERGGSREDVAWLWLEAGRPERAEGLLEELVASKGETAEIRLLLDRLGP